MSNTFALKLLPWDSDFFGFPVARIVPASGAAGLELTAAIAAARHAKVHLVYIFLPPDDMASAATARTAQAWLADRKLTYSLVLPPAAASPVVRPDAVRLATDFTPELESLAWQSGEYSRFRLDPNFTQTDFQGLYSQWLRNSFAGRLARQVLAWYNEAGIPQGLLTLGEKNGKADIGLLAIDASNRGQRVGQALVAVAKDQARAWGKAELQVVTQATNEPGCRFYEKCGFRVTHEEHVYHLWFS